ncbi:hypothetical protein OAV88_02470 [bacterium]|nr:hypothetical protein [bacterium]
MTMKYSIYIKNIFKISLSLSLSLCLKSETVSLTLEVIANMEILCRIFFVFVFLSSYHPRR